MALYRSAAWLHHHRGPGGPRRPAGQGRGQVRPSQLPRRVRLVQQEQRRPRTRAAARAKARVLLVIDWLPMFVPLLLLLAIAERPTF